MRARTAVATLVIVSVFAGLPLAETAKPKKILKVRATTDKDLVAIDEEFRLTLHVELDEGWHINTGKPLLEELVPTTLALADQDLLTLDAVSYPPPVRKSFPYLDRPVELLAGTFEIKASLRFNGKARPGIHVLRGALTYQACNEEACLPPEKASFTVPVMVKPPPR